MGPTGTLQERGRPPLAAGCADWWTAHAGGFAPGNLGTGRTPCTWEARALGGTPLCAARVLLRARRVHLGTESMRGGDEDGTARQRRVHPWRAAAEEVVEAAFVRLSTSGQLLLELAAHAEELEALCDHQVAARALESVHEPAQRRAHLQLGANLAEERAREEDAGPATDAALPVGLAPRAPPAQPAVDRRDAAQGVDKCLQVGLVDRRVGVHHERVLERVALDAQAHLPHDLEDLVPQKLARVVLPLLVCALDLGAPPCAQPGLLLSAGGGTVAVRLRQPAGRRLKLLVQVGPALGHQRRPIQPVEPVQRRVGRVAHSRRDKEARAVARPAEPRATQRRDHLVRAQLRRDDPVRDRLVRRHGGRAARQASPKTSWRADVDTTHTHTTSAMWSALAKRTRTSTEPLRGRIIYTSVPRVRCAPCAQALGPAGRQE
eukprot:7390721-Prymnesium_polylepis.2